MFDNENPFIPQGWRCPICKRVYSPTTSLCLYCGNEQYTTNVATLESQKSLKSFKIMRDFTPEKVVSAAAKYRIPQKPEKPTSYWATLKTATCPTCKQLCLEKITNFCSHCGQALDWSEKNERI